MADERLIAALKRERVGYVQRGLVDRVALVDAELARLGVKPDGDSTPEPDGAPQGRRAPAKRTTDAPRRRTASGD